ncbi:MAG TPA: KamA family protein [Candidatus Paraprevotella stercorigallinarum]|mgnify:FL=1|jgi:lysine 2,3-aminomutase|nr:KamA family protein [Candidatus Paraprevotella stercorigallinarum]
MNIKDQQAKNVLFWDKHGIKSLFEKNIPEVVRWAKMSPDEAGFVGLLREKICECFPDGRNTGLLLRMTGQEGQRVHEISRDEDIGLDTFSMLWRVLSQEDGTEDVSEDFLLDLYFLFLGCKSSMPVDRPERSSVVKWMRRWPDGMNERVLSVREENKRRIINVLIQKVALRKSSSGRYVFPDGSTETEKRLLVENWWNDYHFHLAMAAKTPQELNRMLGNKLSPDTLRLYRKAQEKGMPVFVTPYYLSLLDPSGEGYDDAAIRSYVLYSEGLVETFGRIRAWEREDVVEPGKPNVAGWLLPEGRNIHRRYPEVAILIPDTKGRACGGLCASCQRMYDFQSKRLNFDLESLRPKENWKTRLNRLMAYFEQDTQLRDILITGGDALMSENATLRYLLHAVYQMAVRKRKANEGRPEGAKYAELQRVRLGTRLPVYLPMRINKELLDVLREFREQAASIGVRQFFVQTHFQSPLEVTPEAREALRKIMATGWMVTNQLVYNVAASRRGHTAKLRKVLNELGVVCYYTFSVKGFEENYEVFAPNARSMQEVCEEKQAGRMSPTEERELSDALLRGDKPATVFKQFCARHALPFVATDRNVLNLPGIGKSMTFKLAGIAADGRRILRFSHDHTRRHSPVIHRMEDMYIVENKSIRHYLLQLHDMGERISEYAGLWDYTEGDTEPRFPFFEYPEQDFKVTEQLSHFSFLP